MNDVQVFSHYEYFDTFKTIFFHVVLYLWCPDLYSLFLTSVMSDENVSLS